MSRDRQATAEILKQRQRSPEPSVEQRLQDVLARVREDALQSPQAYARETEVPEGGE